MDFGIASFAAFSVGKLVINDLESSVADTETMAFQEAVMSSSVAYHLAVHRNHCVWTTKVDAFLDQRNLKSIAGGRHRLSIWTP